jgi:hypothetical protein
LKVTCRIPSPIKTTFVSNYIAWEKVDCKSEHRPIVLAAVAEPFFIGKPTRASSKVRTNLPPEEENEIINRC